jgi:hypothetical protein
MNGFEECPNEKYTGSGGRGENPGLIPEGTLMIISQIDLYQNLSAEELISLPMVMSISTLL